MRLHMNAHFPPRRWQGLNLKSCVLISFLKYLAGQVNHLVLADGQLLPKEES